MQRFQENFPPQMGEENFSPREIVPQPKACMIKGPWDPEEDRKLVRLVSLYGPQNWSHISSMLPGRIGKQCRERWYNHLSPNIKKEAWTGEEEIAFVKAHADVGNRWTEIAKRIPGRTENSIKNHWNATKRRQLSKRNYRMAKNNRNPSSVLQDYMISRGLIMEKGKKKDHKEGEEIKENSTQGTQLPSSLEQEAFPSMESSNNCEENRVITDDMFNYLLTWPIPSSSCDFGFALEDQNHPSSVISEFSREQDLEELVSFRGL